MGAALAVFEVIRGGLVGGCATDTLLAELVLGGKGGKDEAAVVVVGETTVLDALLALEDVAAIVVAGANRFSDAAVAFCFF